MHEVLKDIFIKCELSTQIIFKNSECVSLLRSFEYLEIVFQYIKKNPLVSILLKINSSLYFFSFFH